MAASTATLISGGISDTVHYTTEIILPVAHAQEIVVEAPPSVLQLISDISAEYKIASTTLYNLAFNESSLNPDAVGDGGCSYGLTQQNICANPHITKEEALDPAWALRKAAGDIKKGKEYIYTVCNCWAYTQVELRKVGVALPRMAQIQPGWKVAVGRVAIFYSNGMKHIAIITKVEAGGFWVKEANWDACDVGTRFVKWGDKNFSGVWWSDDT